MTAWSRRELQSGRPLGGDGEPDKTARVWDAASGRPVGEPLRHDGWVTAASFSPDGRWVVTAS